MQFDQQAGDLPDAAINRVINRAEDARTAGFNVQLGGSPITTVQNLSPGSSGGIGILAAIVIMLLAFGFVLNDPLRILDVFGLGLTVAILVDATLIRMSWSHL